MSYTDKEVKHIDKHCQKWSKKVEEEQGFGKMLSYSHYAAWQTQASLAGYCVDRTTGRLYKQDKNVRTYVE